MPPMDPVYLMAANAALKVWVSSLLGTLITAWGVWCWQLLRLA